MRFIEDSEEIVKYRKSFEITDEFCQRLEEDMKKRVVNPEVIPKLTPDMVYDLYYDNVSEARNVLQVRYYRDNSKTFNTELGSWIQDWLCDEVSYRDGEIIGYDDDFYEYQTRLERD